MATLKPNSGRSQDQKNYQRIESGKLADAIYRNNTTFRKQLEAELQRLEYDTVKTQRNLDHTQLAFRNKLRAKQQQWLKQQEKTFNKMYHYVYTKKNDDDNFMTNSNNISKANVTKSSKNYHYDIEDYDEDDDYNYDEDDDEFIIEDDEPVHKKPVLVLMNNNNHVKPVINQPVIKPKIGKTFITLSNETLNHGTGQYGTTSNSRATNNSQLLKYFPHSKTSKATTPVEKVYLSNSTNSLSKFQPKVTTVSSLSNLSMNSNVPVLKLSQRSQVKYHEHDGEVIHKNASPSSFTKLPTFIKEYNIDIHRKSNNENDPFVRSYEYFDNKAFKSPLGPLISKYPAIKQQQKQEVTFKLPSAVINKQKFENRVKSSFLKHNFEIHKQQKQQPEHQKAAEDERFVNLVSSLGTF
jgi:hypothetical protein